MRSRCPQTRLWATREGSGESPPAGGRRARIAFGAGQTASRVRPLVDGDLATAVLAAPLGCRSPSRRPRVGHMVLWKIRDTTGTGRALTVDQPLVDQPRARISWLVGADQDKSGLPFPALRPVEVGVVVVGDHTACSKDASGHALQALGVDRARLDDVLPAAEFARPEDQTHGSIELDAGLAEGDHEPVNGTQIPAASAAGTHTLQRHPACGAVVVADLVASSDADMVRLRAARAAFVHVSVLPLDGGRATGAGRLVPSGRRSPGTPPCARPR